MAEAGRSDGRSDPSERLIIKTILHKNYTQSALNQKKLRIFLLPPRSTAQRSGGAHFYTNQLHNTDQLHVHLNYPETLHIYNTDVCRTSGFCVLACPQYMLLKLITI